MFHEWSWFGTNSQTHKFEYSGPKHAGAMIAGPCSNSFIVAYETGDLFRGSLDNVHARPLNGVANRSLFTVSAAVKYFTTEIRTRRS